MHTVNQPSHLLMRKLIADPICIMAGNSSNCVFLWRCERLVLAQVKLMDNLDEFRWRRFFPHNGRYPHDAHPSGQFAPLNHTILPSQAFQPFPFRLHHLYIHIFNFHHLITRLLPNFPLLQHLQVQGLLRYSMLIHQIKWFPRMQQDEPIIHISYHVRKREHFLVERLSGGNGQLGLTLLLKGRWRLQRGRTCLTLLFKVIHQITLAKRRHITLLTIL